MVIDVHAHYVSPHLLEQAKDKKSPVALDESERRLHFPTGPSRPVPQALLDLEKRKDWMESKAIGMQLVSPWMDIVGVDLSASDQSTWCRMYNDTVAADLEQVPALRALAALPLSQPKTAAEELGRAVDELGFSGAAIPTQAGEGLDLDQGHLDPLFEAAESLEVPLFVHPFKVMARQRMDHHFLFNVCGNPFETTLAALRLFFSGVFEAWPKLRLLLAHAGGTLPLLAGRAVHASQYASGFDLALHSSSEILSRFYYDTILHDPKALAFAIEAVGPQRVALGSDYPFPMWLDDPVAHVEAAGRQLNDPSDLITTVADRTPRELFGL